MENNNEILSEQTAPAQSRTYNLIKWYFVLGGASLTIFGIIHAFGVITGEVTYIKIADAIFNASVGIIYFVCAYFFTKGNQAAIWIYGASVLYSLIYAFAVGRGFNYYIAIWGGFLIYQLLNLRKTNELS